MKLQLGFRRKIGVTVVALRRREEFEGFGAFGLLDRWLVMVVVVVVVMVWFFIPIVWIFVVVVIDYALGRMIVNMGVVAVAMMMVVVMMVFGPFGLVVFEADLLRWGGVVDLWHASCGGGQLVHPVIVRCSSRDRQK